MRTGQFRYRIGIYSMVPTKNGFGENELLKTLFKSLRASRKYIGGTLTEQDNAVSTKRTLEFSVRFDEDIQEDMVIGLLNSSVVDNIEIAIEIVSSSYRELQEIISLVRDAIEFQQFEHNGVMTRQSFLRSITETYSNNTRNYMGAVLFNVSTNRLTF